MRKLNKKGITLVELIVSFALIAVAVTYFYQTLLTVNKLYKTSTDETNDFVEKTYALRLLNACYKDGSSCKNTIMPLGTELDIDEVVDFLNTNNISIDSSPSSSCKLENGYSYCILWKNGEEWTKYYPYVN